MTFSEQSCNKYPGDPGKAGVTTPLKPNRTRSLCNGYLVAVKKESSQHKNANKTIKRGYKKNEEGYNRLFDYKIPNRNWNFTIIPLIITVSLRNKLKKLAWYYVNNIFF